jgi:hypothetical protein
METCPTCNGDGTEAVWNETEQMYDEVPCTECGGEGSVFMSGGGNVNPPVTGFERLHGHPGNTNPETTGYERLHGRHEDEPQEDDDEYGAWPKRGQQESKQMTRAQHDDWDTWMGEVEHLGAMEGLDTHSMLNKVFLRKSFKTGLTPAEAVAAGADSSMPRHVAEQMDESTDFDKFMDVTLIKENRRLVDAPEDNPQRRRAKNNQNRPLDRTRFVKLTAPVTKRGQ